MNYPFLAKSSGTEPYQVVFHFADGLLTATCNCQAGVFSKLCKHKLALLQGDEAMLFNPSESQQLRELSSLVQKTAYPKLLDEIHQAELALTKAKKLVDRNKKLLEKAFKEGA
jgi:uncharacterized Zn finger protein